MLEKCKKCITYYLPYSQKQESGASTVTYDQWNGVEKRPLAANLDSSIWSISEAINSLLFCLLCYFFIFMIFFVCPICLATFINIILYNEPELVSGINPGMALPPLPSSIRQGLNPQSSDRELSALLLDHSFCYF